MAELTMFMSTDLSRPVPPVIFATDARGADEYSHGAYGIVAADTEMRRVKLLLEKGLRPGHTVTRLTGEYTGRKRPEEPWRRQVPLTMAEAAFGDIAKSEWRVLAQGEWRFSDHITLGEGRVVVKLARLTASHAGAHGHIIPSLQDNSAVSGSFSKGRSPAPALNFLARQRMASCVGADQQLLLPWVQTTLQPADDASREV